MESFFVLGIIMLFLYGIAFFLKKKNLISLRTSAVAMALFVLLILYNAYNSGRIGYEIVGLSIILLGIVGNIFYQSSRKKEQLIKTQ